MDPLSIAAGAAGFVALTIQLSDKVASFIKSWKNAREDVLALNRLVEQLTKAFSVLHESLERCRLSPDVVGLVRSHLQPCQSSLAQLVSELAKADLLLDPRGRPRQQSQRVEWAWSNGKRKKSLDACEALKACLGFALSILVMYAFHPACLRFLSFFVSCRHLKS